MNLSLIRRKTRCRNTKRIKMKTPCNVLHTSVIKKNGLFGDIRNEISSMIQVTPATTNNRKYNLYLKKIRSWIESYNNSKIMQKKHFSTHTSFFWLRVICKLVPSSREVIFLAARCTWWKLIVVKAKRITFWVKIIPIGM